VNDDGHVANFTETEQVIFSDKDVTSYVLVRGSVPLFWEQPGVNVGSHKIKMSRGSEISQPAFNRHIGLLKKRYGKQHLVTLCGSKAGEANLTRLYKAHHRASLIAKDTPLTDFDYHHYCSRGKTENLFKLKDQISKSLNEFGFFTSQNGLVTHTQSGTFRVNCVDCLDRTNSVETFIGLEMLEKQLQSLKLTEKANTASRFQETFKNMWTLNGDHVSRIYAGTGALEGKSKLKDSTLSVARTIQNNLLDSGKQEAIDFLLSGITLGNEYADRIRSLLPHQYVCLPPGVLKSLCDRHLQFTVPNKVKLMIGTWNVNGGKHFNSIVYKRSDPLCDWLCPDPTNASNNIMDMIHEDGDTEDSAPDIYAIGFEEIVDLNAGNIVAASTSNQMEWLVELQKTISRDTPYVLVTSVQLVGVCLFLFVRPRHAHSIRDVAVDQVKTGLGGATGNKGGVGIRFRFYASTMAFVCAHFAAGQHQVSDRNADFAEISKKLIFPMNRTLSTHDYVFWCGDFNYRIDLDNDYARDLASRQDWRTLLDADQLMIQKNEGKVFDGYVEGRITFPPTYKYDINSDDYDTSEKNRIPAYTDRILFRKNFTTNSSELLANQETTASVQYRRAELKTSDHRPVSALIEVEVLQVKSEERERVLRQTLEEFGPPDGTLTITDSCNGIDGLSESVVKELLAALGKEAGTVILARFGETSFNVIFSQV
jgi:phosphatidylinositol-bisphosphatase